MHKAPLVEAKQIEHVVNERAILGEVHHPFLVGLVGAYQDTNSLYLLQVSGWMGGWMGGCRWSAMLSQPTRAVACFMHHVDHPQGAPGTTCC